MAQDYVRNLAIIAGLAPTEVLALELATEEAFLNIRDHAFPGVNPGEVVVSGEIRDGELRLDYHDQGVPFDPSLLAQAKDSAGICGREGLGLKLIHHAADEVHWVNRGRKGKGLCLVKRLPSKVLPILKEASGEVLQAPAHTYTIRPMRLDEALQVTRIFWLAYGYSYKNEAFYRPEGLVHLVGSGQLVSYVAVTEADEVVAHIGLLRPAPIPMAEMAVLAVLPAHRGRGLMSTLIKALIDKAKEMGLFGISFNVVTSHTNSQRRLIELGVKPCGLDLGACPPMKFKAMGLDCVPPQRESGLYCFLYLNASPAAVVHVPLRHRDIVGRIYAQFGRSLTPASPEQNAVPGAYKVSFDCELLRGAIRVDRADARQWPEIFRAAVDLAEIAGAQTVSLDLPLAQSDTPLLCERAEAEGFFFVGIWPDGTPDGDMLRLMRLAVSLDFEQIRIHPEFGRVLLSYVKAEMERAASAAPNERCP